MSRSFDERRLPGGPRWGAGPNRPLRGIQRAGNLGRVLPGDELENTRDHERLWMRFADLQRKVDKAGSDITSITQGGAAAPSGFGVPEGFLYTPRFDGVNNLQIDGPFTIYNNSTTRIDGDASYIVPIGRFFANYDAGYCLQMMWNASGGAISGFYFYIRRVSSGGAWLTPASYSGISQAPAWAGPPFSGFNWASGPWYSPRLYYPKDATSAAFAGTYSASMEDEFEMCIAFSNNSGFSDGSITEVNWSVGWVAQAQVPESVYALPTTSTADSVPVWDTATNTWVATTTPNFNARVGVRVNSTGSEYKRRRLNFIPGSSKLSVAHADDSTNEEVDITLDVVPANISVTGLSFPGGSGFLDATGAFSAAGGRLNGVLYGTPALGTTRYLIVPRAIGDVDATFDLERVHFRTETPSSSGSVVAILQKATSGSSPSWTDIGTITLTASSYETDVTIGAYTVTTDDLLRLYFTGIGTGCTDYQAIITGTKTS